MPEPIGIKSNSSRGPEPWRCGAVLFIVAILLLPATLGSSQPAAAASVEPPLEYQVRAAFLLNFTKFIEWPALETSNPDTPFNICILGSDPFGTALDQILQGETAGGRKLTVQRIRREEIKSCQVLYLGKTDKDVREMVSSPMYGVLTVGEGESFIRDGGMIAFVIENRRVRFHINLAAAQGAALHISSRLLRVARSVE